MKCCSECRKLIDEVSKINNECEQLKRKIEELRFIINVLTKEVHCQPIGAGYGFEGDGGAGTLEKINF